MKKKWFRRVQACNNNNEMTELNTTTTTRTKKLFLNI